MIYICFFFKINDNINRKEYKYYRVLLKLMEKNFSVEL